MQLNLLGQPRLVWQDKNLPLLGYGALVLGWLALHPQSDGLSTRVRLARALWPDEDDHQARRRLTHTLYHLKRTVPELENHLLGDAHSIGLVGVRVDATEFEQDIQSEKFWQRALESYKGDLLEDLDGAWLEEWRSRLRELFLSALPKALQHFERVGDVAGAIATAQRWVVAEPLSEEAHTAVIRLYASLGRSTEALAQYQTLEQTLKRELNTTPRPETQAFISSLRPSTQTYRPLVGRVKELRALADQLLALKAGQGGVVVLEGEPGLGKTRLLEEVTRLARWHGLALMHGGANEQHQTPYAPLDGAMQSVGELLVAASPLMRETLKPLLVPSAQSPLNSSRGAVGAALERWVLKLSEPLVVLLDDLQWAGDLFWALLGVLSRMARQHQVLLVLAHRSQELQSNPFALEALGLLRREGSVLHLELSGLSLEECGTLAKTLGKTLEPTELDRLYRLSSGNPLVFSEFVLGSVSAEHLKGLLMARFERLEDRAKQALQAASVLGNVFEQAVWGAMLDFVPPLQRLIEARFVSQEETRLAFQHDLIRSLVYQGQSAQQRRGWHSKAFWVLRSQNERAAILAWHSREAGLRAESASMYLSAASEALTFEALSQMREYLHQASAQLPPENHADGLRLRLLQLNLSYKENPSSLSLEELDALEGSACALAEDPLVFDVLHLRLLALASKGDLPAYRLSAQHLLDQAGATHDVEKTIGAMASIAAVLAGEFRDATAALPFAERAYTLSSAGIPYKHRMSALRALLVCHIRLRNIKAMEACVEEAETLFATHPELAGFEPDIHAQRSHLRLSQGRIEEAMEGFKAHLEACRITGNIEQMTRALYNLILTLKIIGQYEEALVWAEELAEHAQGSVEPNKGALFLCSLAEVLVYLGRVDRAERALKPVIPWIEAGSTGDGALRGRNILAIMRGEQCRYLEGYQQMQRNLELCANNPTVNAGNQLLAAELAWGAGLQQEARDLLAKAAPYQDSFGGFLGSWWWLVCYRIEGRAADLEEARMVALAYAATLKNPAYRRSSLEGYYTKQVSKLWEEQDLHRVRVELASEDGKGKTTVVWTLDSGASDQQHLIEEAKVGLRWHRLRRLVLEATAGGAIPTQPELAKALGVTLRTVESDLAALREKGLELNTLGMKRETVQ